MTARLFTWYSVGTGDVFLPTHMVEKGDKDYPEGFLLGYSILNRHASSEWIEDLHGVGTLWLASPPNQKQCRTLILKIWEQKK